MSKIKKGSFNTCPSGKNSYETEDEAKIAVRQNFLDRNIKLNYYVCMLCLKYHMTNRESKVGKRNN